MKKYNFKKTGHQYRTGYLIGISLGLIVGSIATAASVDDARFPLAMVAVGAVAGVAGMVINQQGH